MRVADGITREIPPFLGRFIALHDTLAFLSAANTEILIERREPHVRAQKFLFATIGYVSRPKAAANTRYLVCAELPNCSGKPKNLFLADTALRHHFYLVDSENRRPSLYALLGASETASPSDLRVAWRLRSLECGLASSSSRARSQAERAFNVLADCDLRNCYDALRGDEDAPPVFPYGGFGSILVEGRLSEDGEAFFADRILAYRPEMRSRRASLLLRQCEFLADRLVCRDPRRKLEIWLDASLLPGIDWDLTSNHWRHWFKTRIDVDATFVRTGKYRLQGGEWILRVPPSSSSIA